MATGRWTSVPRSRRFCGCDAEYLDHTKDHDDEDETYRAGDGALLERQLPPPLRLTAEGDGKRQRRPLIMPHEVTQTMRKDEQIIIIQGHPHLRCGRAVYFRRKDMAARAQQNRFAPMKT